MTMQLFFLSSYCFLLLIKKCGAVAPSLVHTPLGDIQGVVTSGHRYFAGIPYAEPPLGSLRFRPALPKKPWQGVYNALNIKARCMQLLPGQFSMSEDCLYLQVYTPPDISSGKLLPVLFWIHGGGFLTGAGSAYNGTNLANQGTVVVTINYRMGAFGFLQSKELQQENSSWPSLGGMNGLNDQLVALQWTIDNIAAFGGNPNDITISGESAGSTSVCILLVSPQTKDLFNHAIMESGSCIGPWGVQENPQIGLYETSLFMSNIGAANVTVLRSISATKILHNPYYTSVRPSLDDFWLPNPPSTYYKSGKLSTRPNARFLLGTNSQDTLYGLPYNMPGRPTDDVAYNTSLKKYFDNNAANVYSLYPPKSSDTIDIQKAWLSLNADTCNTCPVRFLADYLSSFNHTVFLYRFKYNPGYPSITWKDLAGHAFELPYVFHNGYTDESGWPYDKDLSDIMVAYWTDFIHGTSKSKPVWNEYKYLDNEPYLSITKPITMEKGYKKMQCDYWQNYPSHDDWFKFCYQG